MENISQAIFYTLLHSMWQGLLLALLTGLIMVSTRRRPASLRYDLLTAALFFFTAISFFTLIFELNVNESDRHQTIDPYIRHINFLTPIFNYIHQHADIFVAAWLALVLLKSGRMMLGLYTLKRLTSIKTSRVRGFWEQH